MTTEELSFHWADYLVLALSLLGSLGIGVFFFFYDRRKLKNGGDNEEYLMGGRSINPISIGFSSLASTVNAIFLIGAPAEIYRGGLLYSLVSVAWLCDALIAIVFLIPAFRKIKITSCYEYLGVRFNSTLVRVVGSFVFLLTMILFLAVVLYAPSLAFAQVTGISIHVLQIIFGLVCTVYVFMGGLKAVVWTDTFQLIVMLVGCVVVGVLGSYKVGGISEVWRLNQEGNRINFDELSFHPHVRHTVWTQIFFQIFVWIPNYGANQMIVQRYAMVKSLRHAQIAMVAAGIALTVLTIMVSVNGLVMYAYFFKCDPLKAERVSRSDQMFPLLVLELLGQYPGIPGLFTAAVFSAALSSVSSAINSLATVILEDFIKPVHTACTKRSLTDKQALWTAKGLTLFIGLSAIGMSYFAPHMGPVLIQLTPTIAGTVTAPLFGVFLLAIYFKAANAIGALTGLAVSLTFSLQWTVGAILYGKRTPALQPLGQCLVDPGNMTEATTYHEYSTQHYTETVNGVNESPHALQGLYDVSYTYYGLVNILVCVIVGLVVSIIVNCITGGKSKTMTLDGKEKDIDLDSVKPVSVNENYGFDVEKY